jgi:DNA-binding CsgD family transcriptional regulator
MRMDGRRFDRWAQALARKLSQCRGGELEAASPPAGDWLPQVAATPAVANGTCAYQAPATAEPGEDGPGGAQATAICGWEQPPPVAVSNTDAPPAGSSRLTRRRRAQPPSAREQEIAALIAQGLKDREIAAALVLSEHTVHAHVRNLLAKLGLASRTQIAAWVAAGALDKQADQ